MALFTDDQAVQIQGCVAIETLTKKVESGHEAGRSVSKSDRTQCLEKLDFLTFSRQIITHGGIKSLLAALPKHPNSIKVVDLVFLLVGQARL
jgi:hypothetical protein